MASQEEQKKPNLPSTSRGATPKIRPESSISRVLNFDETDSKSTTTAMSKLNVNAGSSSSQQKISKSASSSPSHGKLQHQSSQPSTGSFAVNKCCHPIRPSASTSNVAGGGVAGVASGRKSTSHHHHHPQHHHHKSHSLRYSGSGSDVSNLVRVKNSTLGKSAPSLSANVVSTQKVFLSFFHFLLKTKFACV